MTDTQISTQSPALPQKSTEVKEFKPTGDMLVWVDKSIELKSLSPSEIAEACVGVGTRVAETWRAIYYDWREKKPEFMDFWYTQFRNELKKSASAKVYGRLDTLIDKARTVEEVIQAGEFLEGKKGPNTAIQVNNFNGDKYLEEV